MEMKLSENYDEAAETARAIGRTMGKKSVAMVILNDHHYFFSTEHWARTFQKSQPGAKIHILRSYYH